MPRTLHICGLIKDDSLALQIKRLALRMGWHFSHCRSREEFNFTLVRLAPAPNLLLLEHYNEAVLNHYTSLARVVLENPRLSEDPDIVFLPRERLGKDGNHSGALVKAITSATNLMRVRSLLSEQSGALEASLMFPDVAEQLKRAAHLSTDSIAAENASQKVQPSGTEVGIVCLGVDHAAELFEGIDEPMPEICRAILERVRRQIDLQDSNCPPTQVGFHRDYTVIALLPQIDKTQLQSLAEGLLEAFQRPMECGQTTAYLSISLGLLIADGSTDPNRALALVEHAMSEATDQGGHRMIWAQQDLNLMDRIPLALEREEFSVHFQPQWSLTESKMTGAEALLRWHGLDIGEVKPDRFIRLAESAGAMVSLGDLVIHKACQHASSWTEQLICPITVSLNISPQQIRSNDLCHLLRDSIDRFGLNPRDLELEIDYADFQSLWQHHGEMFRELISLGINFALDKVGNSMIDALALKSWPVRTIKLHRQLVQSIIDEPDAARVAAQLIDMAHTLGIRSVAVGVEDQATHNLLSDLGCNSAQGHFYCKALSAVEFTTLLRNNAKAQVDDET